MSTDGDSGVRAPGSRLSALGDRAAILRALAVAVFLLVALSSTARTWSDTWDAFGRERVNRAAQPTAPPFAYAARSVIVDPGVLEFYAARLRRGDRYVFQAAPSFSPLSNQILLELSAVALLPAVAVEDRSRADVLLSYSADPRPLHLDFPSEQYDSERYGLLPFFVTRLHP